MIRSNRANSPAHPNLPAIQVAEFMQGIEYDPVSVGATALYIEILQRMQKIRTSFTSEIQPGRFFMRSGFTHPALIVSWQRKSANQPGPA